jgi:hypothetical protein
MLSEGGNLKMVGKCVRNEINTLLSHNTAIYINVLQFINIKVIKACHILSILPVVNYSLRSTEWHTCSLMIEKNPGADLMPRWERIASPWNRYFCRIISKIRLFFPLAIVWWKTSSWYIESTESYLFRVWCKSMKVNGELFMRCHQGMERCEMNMTCATGSSNSIHVSG